MPGTGTETIEGTFEQVSEGGFISFHYQREEEVVHGSCVVVGKKEGGNPPHVILIELSNGGWLCPNKAGVWYYHEGGEAFPISDAGSEHSLD